MIKKKQINNIQLNFKFKVCNRKKYKIDNIKNNMMYTKESIIEQL